MFMDTKWLTIASWIVKLLAPLAAEYLKNTKSDLGGLLPNGEKTTLVKLLQAINGDDRKAKEAIKEAQEQVKKIQGE